LFTNVYVKNLPEDYDIAKVDALFATYGSITSSKLAEGKFKGAAFVNLSKPEEAKAAIAGLNGTEIDGKSIYVGRHQKREERERDIRKAFEQRKLERQKQYGGVNLYVKNLSDTIDDTRLLSEFSKFGNITSHKVMLDPITNKSKGFGFVCFTNADDATKAVTEMNGRMFDGKPLYVALAQRKDVRRAQLEAQYAARSASKLGLAPPVLQPQLLYPHPQQQRMLYPQMIPRGRWPGQGSPQVMGVRGQMNYLMPLVGGPRPQGSVDPTVSGGRGGGRGRGGGGIGGGGRGQPQLGPRRPPQQQQQSEGGGQTTPGYKFHDTARNQPQPTVTPTGGSSNVGVEPLTIKTLAAAPEEQKNK